MVVCSPIACSANPKNIQSPISIPQRHSVVEEEEDVSLSLLLFVLVFTVAADAQAGGLAKTAAMVNRTSVRSAGSSIAVA